jgi:hypothetical protein
VNNHNIIYTATERDSTVFSTAINTSTGRGRNPGIYPLGVLGKFEFKKELNMPYI